jgi:hypothetical protein
MLRGLDLTFLRLDQQARLQFDRFEVVIESAFVLRTSAGGPALELNPLDRGELGPFLMLYPGTLVSASVDADAALRLTFVSGAELTVPADPHHEAWQVNGPDNLLLVCEPGGEGRLSAWT